VQTTGGAAVISLPSGASGAGSGSFYTNSYYDLRGRSLSMEVLSAANPATTALVQLQLLVDANHLLGISQQQGTLAFYTIVDGQYASLGTTPYSPTAHLYWRFREDGTNTYWETSPDEVTWTTQGQVASSTLFSLQYLQVSVRASIAGGETNPGVAKFTNVNGAAAPTAHWCSASSLQDDFATSTRSVAWLRSYVNPPITEVQGNGELVITLPPHNPQFSAYGSSASYDLTESSLVVRVPETTSTSTDAQTNIIVAGLSGQSIGMSENDGGLGCYVEANGNYDELVTVPYDPVKHAWWRIREASGVLFCEAAPDGKTWTQLTHYSPLPFPITALEIELEVGVSDSVSAPGAGAYANVNLPPP
jgi:hypothetical protein